MPILSPEHSFESLKARVAEALRAQFPFEGSKRRLELVDVSFDEHSHSPEDAHHIDNIDAQFKARTEGGTWGVPIRGRLRLVDKATGHVIQEKTSTLARLPKLTRRYSFIINGQELQHDSVFRSKPRPYHRIAANGQIQGRWNLARGRGFDINYEPRNGHLSMRVGSTNVPLYPVLHVLGVSDPSMESAWGNVVFTANSRGAKLDRDIDKLFKALNLRLADHGASGSLEQKAARVRTYFADETEVWPDAMKSAFGKPFTRVDGEGLLLSSKRLIDIQKGRSKEDPRTHELPDDRQSLSSKYLATTEDFLVEAVRHAEGDLRKKVADRIDKTEYDIDDILSPNIYNKVLLGKFDNAQRPDQTNPLQFLSGYMRTTIRGKDFGGVGSEKINLDPDKRINPTHLGFLDPVQTPECYTPDSEVFTWTGWKRWADVGWDDLLACRIDGRLEFHRPEKLHRSEYRGPLYGLEASKISYLVTPNHRVFSHPLGGRVWTTERADELHGRDCTFTCVHEAYIGYEGVTSFSLPHVEGNNSSKNVDQIDIDDWAEFMGWYLAEGSFTYDEDCDGGPRSRYMVRISQSRTASPREHARIAALLNRLPFSWCETGDDGFAVYTKQLAHYCKQFGFCEDKFIPEDLFFAPVSARAVLLEALLLGDGRVGNKRGYRQEVLITTSPRLAVDVERLAISLGRSVSHKIYKDQREKRYLDVHEVRLLQHPERSARVSHPRYPARYWVEEYEGEVCCATVPGGLLFVRRNDKSIGFWCGNSEDTGIALHLPLGIAVERAAPIPGSSSKVSSGQDIKTKVYDTKTGQMVLATPADLEHAVVAYPDQVRWFGGKPTPIATDVVCYDEERKTSKRPWSKVRYVLPSAKALFSFSANLIPFLQNNSGNRAMTAAKQQEQAVSLARREEPLVQVKTDKAETFEQVMGQFAAHFTPVGGKVTRVEPGAVTIAPGGREKPVRVPVYNYYPLNGGRNALHAETTVRAGQIVRKGDLIADTNFTKNGTLAMGSNLRVAYVPWKGLNFEDGIVVSETAAKKMASSHMHQMQITVYPGMVGGSPGDRAKWVDHSTPERTVVERMNKLDDRGVVKEGVTVHEGDVLVAALSPALPTAEDEILKRIHKGLAQPFRDSSLVWDHEYAGKVVKVIVTEGLNRKTITVHVATEEPLVVGDKMTGRHGNKGIVSRIIPDHMMPRTGEGVHADVLLNPAGVPSRMNVGQVLETAASKIAEKTGKPYVVENFLPGVDYSDKVKRDLKNHGVTDTEELFDPETGRSIGQILTGKQYMFKLHHMVEKKMTGRSFGQGYTSSGDAPSGSGIPGGGQKMDMLTTYSMLAHGARNNLREAYTFKSDGTERSDGRSADAVWAAVMTGRPLPPPESNRGMKNFIDYMRALGINTEKKGDEYTIMPATDAHLLGDPKRKIIGISNGEIKLPDRVVSARGNKTLEEMGGLFDPKVTGGMKGRFWSHVRLPERMPNPLFESAIQILTGTTKKQYDALVGPDLLKDGKSGFHVIIDKLRDINVDKELAKEQARLSSLSRSDLSTAVKRIRYLEALKQHNMTPLEAYTNEHLPVLPPIVRRVTPGLDGKQMVDDRNFLYAAVGQAVSELRDTDPSKPKTDVQKMRSHLYETLRALKITGTTQTAGKPRHLTGLMEMLSGKTDGSGAPKNSFFQNGVLSRRQDLSGRSTIVPEPTLHLDEVGIPKSIAMEMYRPFVARELHREGVDPLAANRMTLKNRDDPRVLSALQRAVENRPVMLKRDPALHKFSIMAFRPKLVDGKAIKIHPLVTGGFNADFDGDTMALYVPVSEEAVDEARKMMPSRNLFSPTHFGLMPLPGQDSLLGIYQATKWGKEVQTPQGLTRARAVEMMEHGKLKPTDVIVIDGKKTTPGRLSLAQHLPTEMQHDERLLHDPNYLLDKGNLQALLTRVGKEHEQAFPHVVDEWKDLGNKLSYLNGSSFSIDDFHDGKHFRDDILEKYRMREAQLHATPMTSHKKDKELVKLWTEARKELEERGKARYNMKGDNRVWEWAQAKARGNWEQFSQLVYGPMLVQDASKKDVPVPITRSYGEGLSVSEYWASMHGARKGTLDRVQGTREPGAVTKDIINTVMGMHVSAEDCGATAGVKLSPQDPDAIDRYLACAAKVGGDVVEAGQLLTPALATKFMNAGVQQVVLRSPLYCRMGTGICQRCYGKNERGQHHALGTNVGILAGHALGEPITQLTMKCSDGVVVDGSGTAWAMVDYFAEHGVEQPGDGEVRTKNLAGQTLIDGEECVDALALQTHMPDAPMVFIKTRSGHALAVQANHPLWVYDAEGNERVKCAEELQPKVDFLRVDRAAALVPGDRPAPMNPYMLGFFLAEGSTRYGNGTDKYVGVPVASIFTQHDTPQRYELLKRMRADGIQCVEHPSELTVYDLSFAFKLSQVVRGRTSYTKRLQPGFNRWCDADLAQLLAGWIDGDGTVFESSGVTVVKIYTSSFVALQQLEIICAKLRIRCSSGYVSRPDDRVQVKSRHANFFAELRFKDFSADVWAHCERLRGLGDLKYAKHRFIDKDLDPVRKVQVMPKWILPVWDVKTSSQGFTCGMLRNHNTFHTGGASGSGASAVDSFLRVKQLFDLPEKLPDSATLAEVSGTIEKIVHEPAIGFIITIAGKEHRVVTGHPLDHIKVGNAVRRGDPISTGPINPHELLAQTKSIGRVRNYMTDELMKKELYGGLGVRRRNVETVIKGMTNLSEVTDAPPHSPFMRGEHVPLSEIEAHNARAEAEGHETVKHSPKLKPMEQAPLAGVEDWLARLNYQRLKETYTEGAAQGWKSNIKKHPIPGLAHGAEFGLHPFEPTKPPPMRRTPGISS